MAELRRAYLDSCCFVDMVKTDLGPPIESDRQRDVWFLKKLLEANRDKEVEMFTSTLTIAECTHAGEGYISDQVKSLFNRLLMSGQYVRLVQLTPFIAEAARDLRWAHSVALKGADAAHLASALAMKCEEFLTANGRFGRIEKHSGKLTGLGIKPIRGRDTDCLPQKYRQLGFDDNSSLH